MVDHGARAHAHWSASATARNWQCPGSLVLSADAPNTSSVHADTGTAVHEVSERCLRSGQDPQEFLGTTQVVKGRDILFDEECVESAQVYVGYVRSLIDCEAGRRSELWLEERFRLDDLDPPFDAGGTGDAVVYEKPIRQLEVVDLKNGRILVEAEDNKQLRTYGLGALLAHPELAVDTVKVTIVQPRAPHKDGRIRSETFHVADLIDWTVDLLTAMAKSKQAEVAYAAASENRVLLDEWADAWLKPGACTWCPAKGFCPALRRKAETAAGIWLDETDKPVARNRPNLMSEEELAEALDVADEVEGWVSAVRAYGHTRAEGGVKIPGWMLVDKTGNRAWAAEEAKVIHDLKAVVKLTDDDIYEAPKLKSVAQIEKVLGAKRKAEISNMFHRPIKGTNLVREDKTTRPPATPRADQYLETET